MKNRFQTVLRLGLGAAAISLIACSANGGNGDSVLDGRDNVGVNDGVTSNDDNTGDGSNTNSAFPNDGSVGGLVEEAGDILAGNGSEPEKGFVCQQSASFDDGAFIEVGANGLIGGLLGRLLDLLSGDSVDNLLNGVSDTVLAMDSDLRTAAVVTQTLSGLGGLLNSMDVTVNMPDGERMDAGSYAVFAVSFPPSLLELGLLSTLKVKTYLGETVQERGVSIDASAVSLLGLSTDQIGQNNRYALVGYKVTKPYDKAQLSISSNLLSVDVGEKLYIHEFCTAGELVDPPA